MRSGRIGALIPEGGVKTKQRRERISCADPVGGSVRQNKGEGGLAALIPFGGERQTK